MENKEIINREARLRRAAKRKGLYIQKRRWRVYFDQHSYESYIGYCVGIADIGLIAWGGDANGMFMPTLEEAEKIVAEY